MDATFNLGEEIFNYRVAGIWIENGHILLHRQKDDAYWALPGGRAQILEDSKTCLVREMDEELGVSVEVERLLWVVENFFPYAGKNFHEIGFYYLVRGADGKSYYQSGPFFGPEGDRLVYQWVKLSEVHDAVLQPEFLREALKELPEATQHVIVSKK
jgi:ADP-ribose pyrophosphatase YjhB (NUDIX family)